MFDLGVALKYCKGTIITSENNILKQTAERQIIIILIFRELMDG